MAVRFAAAPTPPAAGRIFASGLRNPNGLGWQPQTRAPLDRCERARRDRRRPRARLQAQGRPVGVAMDARGALLVADDVGNTVWRVTAAR